MTMFHRFPAATSPIHADYCLQVHVPVYNAGVNFFLACQDYTKKLLVLKVFTLVRSYLKLPSRVFGGNQLKIGRYFNLKFKDRLSLKIKSCKFVLFFCILRSISCQVAPLPGKTELDHDVYHLDKKKHFLFRTPHVYIQMLHEIGCWNIVFVRIK